MSEARQISEPCVAQRVEDGACRLRAVVATYRSALQAFTLAISPAELVRLRGDVASGGTDPQLVRLRDAVMACGLALPSAIVVAVSGGRMQCESDHLYTLDMRPNAGDTLIVLEGHDRLEQLARGERSHFKTLVTAVLCHTVIDTKTDIRVDTAMDITIDTSADTLVPYQTSSTSRSKWPARM